MEVFEDIQLNLQRLIIFDYVRTRSLGFIVISTQWTGFQRLPAFVDDFQTCFSVYQKLGKCNL